MRAPNARAGFTLIEMLIVTAVVGIVIAQTFVAFSAHQTAATGHERSIEAQEDARLVANTVLRDLRMAGFMVPRENGVASADGGASGSDALCTSDPGVMAPARVAAVLDRFGGARVVAAVGAAATTVQLVTSTMDVDGDTDNDFAAGQGLILADGTSTHCARIVSITGSTLTFAPATPTGFSVTTSAGRAVPAIIWQLGGSGLTRNGMRVSASVEDFQIEFGVDADGDGQLTGGEFPVHDLNGSDPADVRRVQLSVITRAEREDTGFSGPGRPAAANRSGGAADGFRRRRVTAAVMPRNLL